MSNNDKFDKVLNKTDVFVLAFGAMIGWGWVVLSGEWIQTAGTLGAMLAFVLGGVVVLFVGQAYAELTSAMPKCGGEQVFSYRALGRNASFVCTWAIILGYISVIAFETVALPTVIQYLFPNYVKGYMYTIAGFDVYATWLLVGMVSSIIIAMINYVGVKTAAFLQGLCTVLITLVGLALIGGSFVNGSSSNIQPLFVDGVGGLMTVAVMTPFMYVGFDVIPQAAEEMNLPFKKIGQILILSVVMAVIWYAMIIFGVSLAMDSAEISSSALVTADAMAKVYNGSSLASKLLILGGVAGIITSWNSFYVGGSRAIYSMAACGMLPPFLAKLHPKYKTPCNAIILIAFLTTLSPLLGRNMLVWLSNAGGCSIVISYSVVCVSFLVLRKKEPNMPRPYKVKRVRFVGIVSIVLCAFLGVMYLPGAPAGLSWPYEWCIILGWAALGLFFYIWAHASDKVEASEPNYS